MSEGIDRHETLHAVMSVLMWHMIRVMKNELENPEEVYHAELAELTVEKWRQSCEEE